MSCTVGPAPCTAIGRALRTMSHISKKKSSIERWAKRHHAQTWFTHDAPNVVHHNYSCTSTVVQRRLPAGQGRRHRQRRPRSSSTDVLSSRPRLSEIPRPRTRDTCRATSKNVTLPWTLPPTTGSHFGKVSFARRLFGSNYFRCILIITVMNLLMNHFSLLLLPMVHF